MSVQDVLKDNRKFLLLVLLLMAVCIAAVFALDSNWYGQSGLKIKKETYTAAQDVMEENINYKVIVKTNFGDITIDLYEDKAPQNVNSLLFLSGKRYYDGLTFHKVVKDFVIQTGDAVGDGTGTPGYSVSAENLDGSFSKYNVYMANASQFFIVLPTADAEDFDKQYPLVGKVTSGFDVVNSIAKVEVDPNYKPINKVEVNYIQILED